MVDFWLTGKSLVRVFTKISQRPLAFCPQEPQDRAVSDTIPIQLARVQRAPEKVFFDRKELQVILHLYGRMVQAGEWRDYAIDGLKDQAVFSAFRRASEMPAYCIGKQPKLAGRQGQYAVTGSGGQILKRGRELPQVLRVLERKLLKLVE